MPTADHVDIASVLKGKAPVGSRVTVRGWVRTRRDSKAGLSFVHVHDGSCFDPIQVVAPAHAAELRERDQEADVRLRGHRHAASLTASQGQGQAVELQADAVEVVGWVDDPEAYPIQPKQTSFEYLREVAHLRPRTNTLGAVARVRHCLSMAIHRYFHEHGFFWVHTPIVTASDAEGAGEMFRVSTLDLANLGAIPRTPDGRTDFSAGLLRQGSVPDRQRPAERRDLLPGAVEGLHLRADVPRREQQHQPPPGRVLDGRAGDRVRRSRRRRRPRRVVPQVHPHRAAERARRRHEVLRRAHRQGLHRARRGVRRSRRSSA